LRQALAPLASLKLTVVLFSLSMVLVFAGTLAQVDEGIWTVVGRYFRSAWVWIPLQIFFPRSIHVGGGFPFPGGWLIGALLFVNLLAAHAARFKWSWKRAGILLLHAGLIVLIVSEFVTGLFAVEGNMTIDEGGASNYVEHTHAYELAVVSPAGPDREDVVVVPWSALRRGGRIAHASLPFEIEVVRVMANSTLAGLKDPGAPPATPATAGAGLDAAAVEKPEISGTDPDQSVDMPSLYAALYDKAAGAPLGTWLFSLWLNPQRVTAGGRTVDVALRFKRTYKPYTLRLHDFKHEKYIGTDRPRNFESVVRLIDPSRGVDRDDIRIYMNHPLRYEGETFYQSAFKPGDTGTILQVVRNPGWLLPYVSCVMVAAGLLWHFALSLAGFMKRQQE
jgi:hypothetical protein